MFEDGRSVGDEAEVLRRKFEEKLEEVKSRVAESEREGDAQGLKFEGGRSVAKKKLKDESSRTAKPRSRRRRSRS